MPGMTSRKDLSFAEDPRHYEPDRIRELQDTAREKFAGRLQASSRYLKHQSKGKQGHCVRIFMPALCLETGKTASPWGDGTIDAPMIEICRPRRCNGKMRMI